MHNHQSRLLIYFIAASLLSCGGKEGQERPRQRELPRQIVADYNSLITPYLVFDIRADGETKTVAVQNVHVFHRFKEALGLDSSTYVETLQNHIEHNIPFEISRATMIDLQPYFVRRHGRVDSLLALGTEALKQYYFNDRGFLQRDPANTEISYIIKALFDNGVYVTIADFSGDLALYPSTNPSNYEQPPIPDTSLVPLPRRVQ